MATGYVRTIRTLLVDDSLLFREALLRELRKTEDIDIVAQASNPFEARDRIMEQDPDIMVTDINMPKMSGVEFIRKLMAQYPIPTVVVSSNAEAIREAIAEGAVGGVQKPTFSNRRDFADFAEEVADKIRQAMRKSGAQIAISPERFERGDAAPHPSVAATPPQAASVPSPQSQSLASASQQATQAAQASAKNVFENVLPASRKGNAPVQLLKTGKTLIAIGASTGGTDAIAEVMRALPAGLPGIVIVQHMPGEFTGMFSHRLNSLCNFPVVEAKSGDRVEPNKALVAPGGFQFKVTRGVGGEGLAVAINPGEKVSGHCPSVDVMFASVAEACGAKAIGVILTGMGQDGANGLLAMRQAGAQTIGQDERTCIVYGMPKVAFDKGAVRYQLPLDQIAAKIVALL